MLRHSNVAQLFPDPPAAPAPAPNRFEEVWKLCPNKSKKPIARARYVAALTGFKTRTLDKDSGTYVDLEFPPTPEDEIVAGIKAYLRSQIDKNFKLKDDGRFIPHLATFLNQGRWSDLE